MHIAQLRLKRPINFAAVACLLGLLCGSTRAQERAAESPDLWLGMNHGDIDQAALIADLKACGIHMIRDGFNAEPNSTFGAKVDAYVAAGIDAHISVNMRGSGINVDDYPTWLQNYKQRCVDIMTAYKGKLDYYIVGNEPDKHDGFTGRLTPEQAVDFTRMAYEASRQVDPTGGIKVESPPLSSPRPIKDYLKKMLAAGLTDHCDFIGIHVYSNQINDGRLDNPWKLEQAQGGTQKPVAVSEMGTSADWSPKTFTEDQKAQWKADFLDQAYVQLKRYGLANVILFDSSDSSKWPATFDLLRDGTPDRKVLQITFDELKNNLKSHPLQDADFESANDFKHTWVVYDDPADGTWDASAYNFQAPGGHSGGSALQIDTSAGGKFIVRQVVSGVKVDRPVTITAWANSSDQTPGTLKAQGYDSLAGDSETAASTTGHGNWEQLTVTVTPTNPWVVIELSAMAKKSPGSYVKFDDVAVSAAN